MEILVYLAELIQNRRQVGIVGLGTIYKTKVPGRYDADTHAFLPPSYTLQFSTELLEKDALAEYISIKRNISLDSASYFIEQFSDKAVQELSEHNETQLGSLGKLSTVDGSIIFEPAEGALSGSEYFGLPKVELAEPAESTAPIPVKIEQAEDDFVEDMSAPEIAEPAEEEVPTAKEEEVSVEKEEIVPAEEPVAEKEEINSEEEEVPAQENPVEEQQLNESTFLPTEINDLANPPEPQPEEIEENKISVFWKVFLYALLLLIILAAAYFFYPKMKAIYQEKMEESPQLDSLSYETEHMTADSVAMYDDSLQNAVPADTAVVDTAITNIPPAPLAQTPAVTTYEIIIGSLANVKEANKFIAQMKSKGITGKVVDSLSKGKIKVSIASFTDHETALKERRVLVKQLNDPTIFIYTNKPKK